MNNDPFQIFRSIDGLRGRLFVQALPAAIGTEAARNAALRYALNNLGTSYEVHQSGQVIPACDPENLKFREFADIPPARYTLGV